MSSPWRKQLAAYAQALRDNMPKSERWFHAHYQRHDKDKINHPLGPYIPDIHNNKLKYVIEIDGSIHETPEQQAKDRKKDEYYRKHGYRVFRVTAYCADSLGRFLAAYEQSMGRRKRQLAAEGLAQRCGRKSRKKRRPGGGWRGRWARGDAKGNVVISLETYRKLYGDPDKR